MDIKYIGTDMAGNRIEASFESVDDLWRFEEDLRLKREEAQAARDKAESDEKIRQIEEEKKKVEIQRQKEEEIRKGLKALMFAGRAAGLDPEDMADLITSTLREMSSEHGEY